MKTITATNARSNLFNLLNQTMETNLPTRVTSKKGSVVIISEEDYESLVETAELLSQKGLKESIKKADKEIKEGKTYTFDQVFGKE